MTMTLQDVRAKLLEALRLDLGPSRWYLTGFLVPAEAEAAQVRNIEVGVLLRSPLLAERLAAHVAALATAGRLEAVPGL